MQTRARPVKRAVQQQLETALAKSLLRGDFQEEDTVVVSAPGGATADHLDLRTIVGPRTGSVGASMDIIDVPAEVLS